MDMESLGRRGANRTRPREIFTPHGNQPLRRRLADAVTGNSLSAALPIMPVKEGRRP